MEFIFLATLLGLMLWLTILISASRPYSTNQSLDAQSHREVELSEVSVLIPARNEKFTISETLLALKAQNPKKIILIDDQSTDNTAKFAKSTRLHNLLIIKGDDLPKGWSGKLWALEQGLKYVETNYLVLLDADIILKPDVIREMLSKAKKNNIQLVSLMAHLRMSSYWEKLFMPSFIFFFKLLYPFHLSNSPYSKVAAGAGGCMLLETKILKEIGGFKSIKNELIDDCSIAKKIKGNGYKIWIGLTHSVISIRKYNKLKKIKQMITRNAYAQLRYSPALLLFCMLLMIIAFLVPVIAIFQAKPMVIIMGYTTLFIQAVCYLPTLRYYSISAFYAFTLPFTSVFYLFFTLNSAYRYYFSTGAVWKGRYYKDK